MKTLKIKEESLHRQVCNYLSLQYPNVIFNTDLSGIKLTIGQAAKVARLRSSKSFPDIVIYEPRGIYSGLFLELKKDKTKIFTRKGQIVANSHIQAQCEMMANLRNKGYMAEFAIGFDHAKKLIDNYMIL